MAIYVAAIDHTCSLLSFYTEIQLLEYPIPPRPRASQKPSSADISETESGIIDPLVSKSLHHCCVGHTAWAWRTAT